MGKIMIFGFLPTIGTTQKRLIAFWNLDVELHYAHNVQLLPLKVSFFDLWSLSDKFAYQQQNVLTSKRLMCLFRIKSWTKTKQFHRMLTKPMI